MPCLLPTFGPALVNKSGVRPEVLLAVPASAAGGAVGGGAAGAEGVAGAARVNATAYFSGTDSQSSPASLHTSVTGPRAATITGSSKVSQSSRLPITTRSAE